MARMVLVVMLVVVVVCAVEVVVGAASAAAAVFRVVPKEVAHCRHDPQSTAIAQLAVARVTAAEPSITPADGARSRLRSALRCCKG